MKSRLHSLYEAGQGVREEITETTDNDLESDDEEVVAGARILISPETFMEELSQKLEIHPISIYWLLKEGVEEEGWRCLPEERKIISDRVTVTILRLLGHRWPKQIETGESVPEWADQYGVIPLTDNTSDTSLLARVCERLTGELKNGNSERNFEEVMGKSLIQWLSNDFFKTHMSQFKKRPVAWQLQSAKFTARQQPALSCILYYHKLDGTMLPTIQSQYIRPLRQRFETEMRGIEAIDISARSDRQVTRRIDLEGLIDELRNFDDRISNIAEHGFGLASLCPQLRQYAINDAILALKVRWLTHLVSKVKAGPIQEWQKKVRETGLHPDFADWVTEAVTHLNYSCACVGPAAPKEDTLKTDPTAVDLANLICPHATEMVKDSLHFACDRWWKSFDTSLLAPLREQMKAQKDELSTIDAELKDQEISFSRRAELESRQRILKAEIKSLKSELDGRTTKGKAVRKLIEAWTCPEAATWEPWLGSQPLYDQISALDGTRTSPSTVGEFIKQESAYVPDINDGVRVNIAPLQRAGILAADVLAGKDIDKAIADRAEWRSDERRWCREGKLPQPGWWN